MKANREKQTNKTENEEKKVTEDNHTDQALGKHMKFETLPLDVAKFLEENKISCSMRKALDGSWYALTGINTKDFTVAWNYIRPRYTKNNDGLWVPKKSQKQQLVEKSKEIVRLDFRDKSNEKKPAQDEPTTKKEKPKPETLDDLSPELLKQLAQLMLTTINKDDKGNEKLDSEVKPKQTGEKPADSTTKE